MADIDHQPREDLAGPAASAKIKSLFDGVRTCMFGTRRGGDRNDFRPMALQAVEDDGSLWFLSSTQSDKNADIAADANVDLLAQDDASSKYVVLSGKATVYTDPATKDKYWTAFANNWFDGKDDPRVSVIGVRPTGGHYWQAESGKIVQMAKLMLGAVTGGAIKDDGGIEGALRV